ncbi:MAG TPA: hypothetical protein VFY43_03050 [Candidatus Limnocylindria bacterium]|nr:hypothetical protein [Candidatus Limnocylindria bacterium]
MRPLWTFALLLTLATVAACSIPPTPPAALPTSPTEMAIPSSASTPTSAAPTPDARRLQDLLPADFRGTEAHTFAVGQDMLARLATALGIRRRALEAAYASDHGPAFVQMYALRAPGHDPQELLDALPGAAYPAAPAGAITVEVGQLAGRAVTVITEASQAATIGSFYAFTDGGALIVAQALAEPVAEAAFDELPPS